jgi:sodium/potassium/calcium exchanger 6
LAIFWIWFIAKNLIDILKAAGIILNIPASFLGMTLLAFGNSAPGKNIILYIFLDLSLNVALAKNGYGEMGIAGSIAGPLFNTLVGLGISLLKNNIITGADIKFDILIPENMIIIVCLICLSFNLVRLLIHAIILRFNLTRSVSYIGFFVYAAFLITICILCFVK